MIRKKLLIIVLLAFVLLPTMARERTLRCVEQITVDAPVGTVPCLPWRVWVTYSDETGEWRQTRWNNSARAVEEEEATRCVGDTYTVQGFIIGDNTWSILVQFLVDIRSCFVACELIMVEDHLA